MQDEGYAIMPVSSANQLMYGCNCLNLGAGRIISVHEETARQIVNFDGFVGHVQYIDWSPITSMYGAVHCGSQVIVRSPLPSIEEEGTNRGGKRFKPTP
jgi:N-dimethylarginine dimethylaminohydrolase